MPQIDVADETWIAAAPQQVAAVIADWANWRSWWPDFELTVDELRGPQGVRWFVRATRRHRATGSMEVWLEAVQEGVVLHYFLRLEQAHGRWLSPRRAQRAVLAERRRAKRIFWAVKDRIEAS